MNGDCVIRTLVSLAIVLVGGRASEVDGDTNPRSICTPATSNHTLLDFNNVLNVYENETLDLAQCRGKVTLMVNTATY